MIILWCALSVIAGIIGILIFAEIKVYFSLKNEVISLTVKIWGVTLYKLKKSDAAKKEKKKKEKEPEPKEDQQISLREKIHNLKDKFHHIKHVLEVALEQISDKLKVEGLTILIRFGDGNAATTAIETGVLWGILGGLNAILNNYLVIENSPDIQVIPDFNNKFIEVYADSIIKTRIVHIITIFTAVMSAYKNYEKNKK